MKILSLAGMILIFLVLPIICGSVLTDLLHVYQGSNGRRFLLSLVSGNLLMWAAFEAVAVPLIFLRADFRMVILLWAIVLCAFVAVYALVRRRLPIAVVRGRDLKNAGILHDRIAVLLLVLFLAVVAVQCVVYFWGMHLDEDDSRFVAHSVYTWKTNQMLTENPATGELNLNNWNGDYLKDVFSPWMIYIALIARVIGIHPAITAHTILPVVLLVLSYIVWYLAGSELFENDKRKTFLFCFLIGILQLFFAGSTRTQSEFTLLRIWQGKAVVAGIGIPMILYGFLYLYRKQEDERFFWMLLVTDWTCCLLSGMGIILATAMIGMYSLWYVIAFRKWKMIWKVPLVLLPSIFYGSCIYLYKIGRLVL
ncbi:MAG: DUF6077 domain-containing protein [Eubacterium sp.]|nr:DUF6077 domain-containing protein [Eubacterium sp.]